METETVWQPDLGQAAEELADLLHRVGDAKIEYFHTQMEGEDAHVFKVTYEVKV